MHVSAVFKRQYLLPDIRYIVEWYSASSMTSVTLSRIFPRPFFSYSSIFNENDIFLSQGRTFVFAHCMLYLFSLMSKDYWVSVIFLEQNFMLQKLPLLLVIFIRYKLFTGKFIF